MVGVRRQKSLRTAFVLGIFAFFACAADGATPSDSLTPEMKEQLANLSPGDRTMVERFTPELQPKFLALSPVSHATIKKVQGSHTRHSKKLTVRQVMQEVLAEYQGIAAGVATDNAEQAADRARRVANHRIPAGNLIPYSPLDRINEQSLSALPALNDAVEGAALRLAGATDQGDMAEAETRLGEIASGRAACHQFFRGRPGVSLLLFQRTGNDVTADWRCVSASIRGWALVRTSATQS